MAKKLFKDIDNFKSNSDLFINFAFFQFISCLGTPFVEKVLQNQAPLYNDANSFFNSLKIPCKFKRTGTNSGYLEIYPNKNKSYNENNNDEIDLYKYSDLKINSINRNIIIKLSNGDKYDKKTGKVYLCPKTMATINENKVFNISSNCELYFNDQNIKKDPTIKALINLYLNNKSFDKIDFKAKRDSFEKKITSPPNSENKSLFEIVNGNNRIKYENLQKGEIYFFQGPPGTGKTYVIKRLIEENEHNPKFKKIIVSSYVNVAINNIIEKLIGKTIPEDKYAKLYDFYQYMTILYSNRALTKIEDSPASELIELDTLINELEIDKAEDIYKQRKIKSKDLINDFDNKLEDLTKANLKNYTQLKDETLSNSHKFKRIFEKLNDSNTKYIDYEKIFELTKELSNKHYKEFVRKSEINWGVQNYSEAIKNYSNVIFCTLSNLPKELDRQNSLEDTLVIIDEASQSDIINYLLLLNNIDKITLIILGDPQQLNRTLLMGGKETRLYSKIMTAFQNSSRKKELQRENYPNRIIEKMKEILFNMIKYKDNKPFIDKNLIQHDAGYEKYSDHDTILWNNILTETFYEKLFKNAAKERRILLNIHRRSREEIFNLNKDLYDNTYTMGPQIPNDNLLIPGYNSLARIVVDDSEESIKVINNLVDKWQKQKAQTQKEDMSIGIITYYNQDIEKIKKDVKEINNTDISVYTIDKSQGEQFTNVIVYMDLINNNIHELSNILDYHRLNVAVSRAIEQLIIIETKKFVEKYNKFPKEKVSPEYQMLIKKIHEIPESGDSNE